jgi:hypothetical protein
LDNWLNPNLGDLPVSAVNNGAVKHLVPIMLEGGLSAKTINSYVGVMKTVVASAVNEEGEELYPRKWAKLTSRPLWCVDAHGGPFNSRGREIEAEQPEPQLPSLRAAHHE